MAAFEKYAFAGLALLAVAFAAFVFLGGGAHAAAPAGSGGQGATVLQQAQGQTGAAASGAQAGGSATGAVGTQAGAATQEVSLTATASGYDKTEIHVKAGVPVHFTFTANGAGCGSQLIIDKVGVSLVSRGSPVDATFTPPTPGNYPYHCGMNMFRGVLVAE